MQTTLFCTVKCCSHIFNLYISLEYSQNFYEPGRFFWQFTVTQNQSHYLKRNVMAYFVEPETVIGKSHWHVILNIYHISMYCSLNWTVYWITLHKTACGKSRMEMQISLVWMLVMCTKPESMFALSLHAG